MFQHTLTTGMDTEKEPTYPKGALKFPKSERLSHATLISRLFEQGESVYAYPLRLTYRLAEVESVPAELLQGRFQYMVKVPKKRFKRAVHRVRLRRLMREAWRQSRVPLRDRFLAEKPGMVLHMGVVYVGTDMAGFEKIVSKTGKLIAHLENRLFASAAESKEQNRAEHESN